MKDIRLETISKSSSENILFEGVSFQINEGDHIGLIGRNGVGKTTLLNIIAGNEPYEQGAIYKPNEYTIAFSEQEPNLDQDLTVFDAVYASNTHLMKVVRAYEDALAKLSGNNQDEKLLRNFQQAQNEMDLAQAWQYEASIKSILNQLGITNLFQQTKELSGGQKKRLSLAKVLIEQADLLILDEPTNHLDFEMIDWLEDFIKSYKGSVLIVSHDRYFLDNTVTKMIEIENRQIYSYQGNYQAFLEQKSEREREEMQSAHKQKQLYNQELSWMRHGAKARTTKQQARINRFELLESSYKSQETKKDMTISLDGSRIGKRVFEFHEAAFAYPNKEIFTDLNWIIQNSDRIGIVGHNGAGKSSLLNIIAQDAKLTSGELITGETVRIGYYRQDRTNIPADKRVSEFLQEVAQEVKDKYGEVVSIHNLLEEFKFPRERHSSFIGMLSGGEQKRLYLLRILLEKPNVLLLDEPTNDLDLETLTILEEFIQTYNGVVITVSHDRYFLDKVVNKLLVFDEGSTHLRLFYGDMTDYREFQKELQLEKQKTKIEAKPIVSNKNTATKKKLSYHEEKEWQVIEDEIFELENQLEANEQAMIESASDLGKLMDLQNEKAAIEKTLSEKMTRWEYLASIVEGESHDETIFRTC